MLDRQCSSVWCVLEKPGRCASPLSRARRRAEDDPVDHDISTTALDQLEKRPAAADFDVITMRPQT